MDIQLSGGLSDSQSFPLGYGHSCPKTLWGRMFTMLYASLGIPLGLVMFNSIGKTKDIPLEDCSSVPKERDSTESLHSTLTRSEDGSGPSRKKQQRLGNLAF